MSIIFFSFWVSVFFVFVFMWNCEFRPTHYGALFCIDSMRLLCCSQFLSSFYLFHCCVSLFLFSSLSFKMSGKIPKVKKEKVKGKENEKSTRSKRFSQVETDLLCDLVLSSDINTMVTNKITPYGRLRGWDDVARSFNASAHVTVSYFCVICLQLCTQFKSGSIFVLI